MAITRAYDPHYRNHMMLTIFVFDEQWRDSLFSYLFVWDFLHAYPVRARCATPGFKLVQS